MGKRSESFGLSPREAGFLRRLSPPSKIQGFLDGLAYELAPNVVTSSELEKRIQPVYDALRFQVGQIEALTGIKERRWWNPGFRIEMMATCS